MPEIQDYLKEFDGRGDFEDGLEEMLAASRSNREFTVAMRLRRVLRRRSLFEKVYQASVEASATALVASPRVSEFGDGEFGKWFLEWLSDGGWETILEIIKTLISLFG